VTVAHRLRIRPEAEAEVSSAAAWYEAKRPGLGVDFVAMVDRAFEQIVDAPEASAVWQRGYPYRKHVMRRFPYVVFYEVTADGVEVVAVAHAKRRPGYWRDR
jgi:plasmid stabilization system protein ParE